MPFLAGFPSNKFAAPRSYVRQLSFKSTSNDIEQFGDLFKVWLSRPIGYFIAVQFFPYVLPWSSNRYTLDFLIEDLWWEAFFDSVHHPDIYNVWFLQLGEEAIPTWRIELSTGGSVEPTVPLDIAPAGYWLPP